MNFRKEIDAWGRKLAYRYLEENNYHIENINFQYKEGKNYIIANRINKKELVFIKVKTCSNFKYGSYTNINSSNQDDIEIIKYYINKNNIKNINIYINTLKVYIRKEGYKIKSKEKLLKI